jgi:hypothetical protein
MPESPQQPEILCRDSLIEIFKQDSFFSSQLQYVDYSAKTTSAFIDNTKLTHTEINFSSEKLAMSIWYDGDVSFNNHFVDAVYGIHIASQHENRTAATDKVTQMFRSVLHTIDNHNNLEITWTDGETTTLFSVASAELKDVKPIGEDAGNAFWTFAQEGKLLIKSTDRYVASGMPNITTATAVSIDNTPKFRRLSFSPPANGVLQDFTLSKTVDIDTLLIFDDGMPLPNADGLDYTLSGRALHFTNYAPTSGKLTIFAFH